MIRNIKKGSNDATSMPQQVQYSGGAVKLSLMSCMDLIFGLKNKENFPLKLVLMTPQTICGSIYETSAGWNYSYTQASKLMDQLKVFVGTAIFLSQMATSRGITSVSNSAPYQQTLSLRGEMDPLFSYPHSAGEAHGGQESSSKGTCYFVHIILPALSPLLHAAVTMHYNHCSVLWSFQRGYKMVS